MTVAGFVASVRIFSPTPANRQRLAAEFRDRHGLDARDVASAEDAVKGAELVVAAVKSTEPVLDGRWLEPGATNAQVIYILYLAGLVIGVSALVGIILAYINRGKAGGFVETHYTWLIRTFWIGLLYALVSAFLMFVMIGFLLMFAVAVWFIARCIIGLQALGRGEPIRNPESWVI